MADPVFFINHNGDLDILHELIGLAKDAGRDVVKLQKCSVEIVYTDKLLPPPSKVHGARPSGVKS